MNKKINFDRLVNFTGRNGFFKQSGVCIYHPTVPATLGKEHEVIITPLTSKGKEGNCSIAIPNENVLAVVDALLDVAIAKYERPKLPVLGAIQEARIVNVVVSKKKKKYLLITIEERNGESEYTFRALREVDIRTNVDNVADKVARGWYEDGQKRVEEDGGYYFFAGCFHVKVERVEEISESDFLTLSKYI